MTCALSPHHHSLSPRPGAPPAPPSVSHSLLSSHTTPHTLFTCPFCNASLAAKFFHVFLKAGFPEPTFSCDDKYLSHRTRSPHASSPARPPEQSCPATAGGSDAPLRHGPRGRQTRGRPAHKEPPGPPLTLVTGTLTAAFEDATPALPGPP